MGRLWLWSWLCSCSRGCARRGAGGVAGIYSQQCVFLALSDRPHLTIKINRPTSRPGGDLFFSPCKFRSECGVARRATRQERREDRARLTSRCASSGCQLRCSGTTLHRRRLTWLEAWGGTATVLNAGLWWTQIVGGGRSQRGGRFQRGSRLQRGSRFQHTRESSLPRLQHNMERSMPTRHAASTCQPSGLINSGRAAFAGTRRRCLGAHYCCPQAQGRSLSTISWRRCWAGLGRSSISTTCTISE